jgi:uncharacterized protein YdeI (YjbR/CyaY-like superfamily)
MSTWTPLAAMHAIPPTKHTVVAIPLQAPTRMRPTGNTARAAPPKSIAVPATFFADPSEFRAWLERHHAGHDELLVGFWKKASGKPSMTWSESVDEALSFGWIDGVRRSLGEDAYTIRFTPRRPRSIWSAVNVAKAEALIAEGRMHPAGLAAFEARTPQRTGVYSHENRKAARFSPDQEVEFRADAKAWAWFESRPPSYRRMATWWVVSAKKEETRRRRLTQLIEDSRAGRTVPPLTRP